MTEGVENPRKRRIEIEESVDPEPEKPQAPESRFQVSDRRFWVQDEESIDRAQPPSQRLPSYVEELKARTELAESRLREKLEQIEADNEAFRLRLRKESANQVQREILEVLSGFLEIIDNLERALESAQLHQDDGALEEGVRLNLQLFLSKLAAAGIEPLAVEGEPFDPHTSEAVSMVAVEDPELDQKVVEVVSKGYRQGEKLLRPARVRVGSHQRVTSGEPKE